MMELETKKEVRIEPHELEDYLEAVEESGEPTLINHRTPNESMKILLKLRDRYDFPCVEKVEITPEGIMRYTL